MKNNKFSKILSLGLTLALGFCSGHNISASPAGAEKTKNGVLVKDDHEKKRVTKVVSREKILLDEEEFFPNEEDSGNAFTAASLISLGLGLAVSFSFIFIHKLYLHSLLAQRQEQTKKDISVPLSGVPILRVPPEDKEKILRILIAFPDAASVPVEVNEGISLGLPTKAVMENADNIVKFLDGKVPLEEIPQNEQMPLLFFCRWYGQSLKPIYDSLNPTTRNFYDQCLILLFSFFEKLRANTPDFPESDNLEGISNFLNNVLPRLIGEKRTQLENEKRQRSEQLTELSDLTDFLNGSGEEELGSLKTKLTQVQARTSEIKKLIEKVLGNEEKRELEVISRDALSGLNTKETSLVAKIKNLTTEQKEKEKKESEAQKLLEDVVKLSLEIDDIESKDLKESELIFSRSIELITKIGDFLRDNTEVISHGRRSSLNQDLGLLRERFPELESKLNTKQANSFRDRVEVFLAGENLESLGFNELQVMYTDSKQLSDEIDDFLARSPGFREQLQGNLDNLTDWRERTVKQKIIEKQPEEITGERENIRTKITDCLTTEIDGKELDFLEHLLDKIGKINRDISDFKTRLGGLFGFLFGLAEEEQNLQVLENGCIGEEKKNSEFTQLKQRIEDFTQESDFWKKMQRIFEAKGIKADIEKLAINIKNLRNFNEIKSFLDEYSHLFDQ
ncbi:MAG: hypothetical protein LBK29_01575 [Oscillospiraceae bacterium]|jgi:hypothetical protein|nr:hypothetical protein [Oscillospiraceae bacterium]